MQQFPNQRTVAVPTFGQSAEDFAQSLTSVDEIRSYIDENKLALEAQRQHLHEMADQQTSWVQIGRNIKLLMKGQNFMATPAVLETYGTATWQEGRYEEQLDHIQTGIDTLEDQNKALLKRLYELEPMAAEKPPEPEQPEGPHADTRVRKTEH